MNKIREIIRLHQQCDLSARAISRALHISRPVVAQYLQDVSSAGLTYEDISEMDDETFIAILKGIGQSRNQRHDALLGQFEHIAKELKSPGVTLRLLWEEYRNDNPDTYSYSQFCYHFQIWRNSSELTMHMSHKAGDKIFVDFTGKHLHIVERNTGELKAVEIFVAVLGASQLTYVEAVSSQRKDDWIKANCNAFDYFGGVPQAVVPDCLKTAVQQANRYEPEINLEYLDFARHYQTTILPARPARPKDKALVEGAVKIVYAWIFAALRNQIFHTLEELNSAIQRELQNYNAKPMQRLKISRQQLFSEIEKNVLKPLPEQRYTIRHFRSLKAQFNYHIYLSDDRHYYSVPYRYRGKQIQVIFTDSVVELFYKNRRIAWHKRDRKPNDYSTEKSHMPSHHRAMTEWNPQRFISWAENVGDYVKVVIEQILGQRKHPEQAYKVCLGILNLAKKFDKERLNKACQKAVEYHHYSYKGIKRILENRTEELQQDIFEALPEHQNIRGNQYYHNRRQS